MTLTRICVYCGSSAGNDEAYGLAAESLGRIIAQKGMTLVYGGAKVGNMGRIADAALAEGGTVVGVIPRALVDKEIAHTGLSDLHVVTSMHERKAKMAALSDGFIAMPGGLGTLEELFEMLTWSQLGFHQKPCGLLNVRGYYNELLRFLEKAVAEGFIRKQHEALFLQDQDPETLLTKLAGYQAPVVQKWIGKSET